MKTIWLFVLLTSAVAQDVAHRDGMSKATIRGHCIGETVAEYLVANTRSADGARQRLEECSRVLESASPKRPSRAVRDCVQLSQAIDGKLALFGENLVEYLFSEGRLVEIRVYDVDDFAKVRHDLIEKFGPPDSEEQVAYQNGFGAIFNHPQLRWRNLLDAYVEARENPEAVVDLPNIPPIYTTTVEVVQRAWADKLAREEQAQPSPLD